MYRPIDESSDVYSYGAAVYTILTGEYLATDLQRVNGPTEFEVRHKLTPMLLIRLLRHSVLVSFR